MSNFLLFLSVVLSSFAAYATYSTSCEIRQGKAYGYIHNHGESFEIDGNVWFYFYDNSGQLIDDEDEYEYEYVSSRDIEEIETTSAPSNAASCFFNVSTALKK